eukprot:TRINITY_DN26589_c0_g1_i1.p2 TRINITY_DN26589_c0_g1~~TRINITY_DN26589_c0_g1_i1.p2  ORF type:complete len:504 (+),score=254.35 TRINITY_DN26589_c0_g1_i1:62-1573(+)
MSSEDAAAVLIQAAVRGWSARRALPGRLQSARRRRWAEAEVDDAAAMEEQMCTSGELLERVGGDPEAALDAAAEDELCGRALAEAEEELARRAARWRYQLSLSEAEARSTAAAEEAACFRAAAAELAVDACCARGASLLTESVQHRAAVLSLEQRRRRGVLRAALPALLLQQTLDRGSVEDSQRLALGLVSRREIAARSEIRGRALFNARVWREHAEDFGEREDYRRYRLRSAEHADRELLRIAQQSQLAEVAGRDLARLPAEEGRRRAAVRADEEAAFVRTSARRTTGFLACAERELLPGGGAAELPGTKLVLHDEAKWRRAFCIDELRERGEVYGLFDRRLGQLSLWYAEKRETARRGAVEAAEVIARQKTAALAAEQARALAASRERSRRRRQQQRDVLSVWDGLQRLQEAASQQRARLEKAEEGGRREAQRAARLSVRLHGSGLAPPRRASDAARHPRPARQPAAKRLYPPQDAAAAPAAAKRACGAADGGLRITETID